MENKEIKLMRRLIFISLITFSIQSTLIADQVSHALANFSNALQALKSNIQQPILTPPSEKLIKEVLKQQPNINIIKELVTQGADINSRDANGETVLLLSLVKQPRKENIAIELLNLGADPNLGNTAGGFTALMDAARKEYFQPGYGNTTLDQTLINKGAKVNAVDNAQKTALLYAAQAYNLPSLKLLLNNGADPNVKNKQGENALNLVAQWYLNHKELFKKNNKLDELKKLVSDIIDTLIETKIDINNKPPISKTTPLEWFEAAGETELVEKLMKGGAKQTPKVSGWKSLLKWPWK